jgi:hypothetical protein
MVMRVQEYYPHLLSSLTEDTATDMPNEEFLKKPSNIKA